MATLFVASGGSNTAPYETWAKAATSLQTAISAVADGDVVVIQRDAVPAVDASLSADTTYTFAASCALISAANDGGSAYTQSAMAFSFFVGHSTLNRSISLAGAVAVYVYGVTFRVGGTGADNIRISASSGGSRYLEDCTLWTSNSNASSNLQMGGSTTVQSYAHMRGCTIVFGNTAQKIQCTAGKQVFEEVSISAAGSAPTQLIDFVSTAGSIVGFYGCDLANADASCLLVPNSTLATAEVEFVRCKMPTSYVALDTQTELAAGARVTLLDCSAGDVHGEFGYYDAFGSVVTDRTNYLTAGDAGMSWKITTTASASKIWPFRSPWIDFYNTALSSVTPSLEVLRNNGSAVAYTNQDVWAQVSVKNVSGSTVASLLSDRAPSYNDTPAAQAAGVGTGSWTIAASSSPYSLKCDSGAAVTPAEVGEIRARLCVAVPSTTLYLDPQIRT